MSRRPFELHTGDWVDVFCTNCHRRIYDGEWRDETEYVTLCRECYDRAEMFTDNPRAHRPPRRHPRYTPQL